MDYDIIIDYACLGMEMGKGCVLMVWLWMDNGWPREARIDFDDTHGNYGFREQDKWIR